jgi:hypothetical protein
MHGHCCLLCVQDKVTGDLVTDHKAIAKRYLTGWFIVDLLATFPVDYIVRAVEVRMPRSDLLQGLLSIWFSS